jgi:hypothetical protein
MKATRFISPACVSCGHFQPMQALARHVGRRRAAMQYGQVEMTARVF